MCTGISLTATDGSIIVDSFSIPVGMTAEPATQATDIQSATQITVVSDLTNRAVYFHTMHDRAVRAGVWGLLSEELLGLFGAE